MLINQGASLKEVDYSRLHVDLGNIKLEKPVLSRSPDKRLLGSV